MRKPTLHDTFNYYNTIGLSNLLENEATFDQVLFETNIPGLQIVPSGAIPPNPSELLSSKQLDKFMKDMEQYFDIVIFDGPPVLLVTDSQILANKCDGTILVVNAGKVDKEVVEKVKTTIYSSHGNLLGVILNNYNYPKNHYYTYYKKEK